MTDDYVTDDLLPCPFCGEVKRVRPQNGNIGDSARGWHRLIWCENCGASSRDWPTEAEVIAAWNRRSSQSGESGGAITDAEVENAHRWLAEYLSELRVFSHRYADDVDGLERVEKALLAARRVRPVAASPGRPQNGPLSPPERQAFRDLEIALNRRTEVEGVLLQVAGGKRGPLTPDECRALAVKLAVPLDALPKAKG